MKQCDNEPIKYKMRRRIYAGSVPRHVVYRGRGSGHLVLCVDFRPSIQEEIDGVQHTNRGGAMQR